MRGKQSERSESRQLITVIIFTVHVWKGTRHLWHFGIRLDGEALDSGWQHFSLVEYEWCELLNAFGHSNKLKESRMPRSRHECSENCFGYRWHGYIIKVIYIETCIFQTHEWIKLKGDWLILSNIFMRENTLKMK